MLLHLLWSIHRGEVLNYSAVSMVSISFPFILMFATNADTCLFPISVLHLRRRFDSTDVAVITRDIKWWSVGSMVSRRPILQTCNVFVVMIEETDIVPTSAQFFAVGTPFIVRSPSRTRSCIQKYRVWMCFVLGPAPNRSVNEFDVELSLRISTSVGIPRSMYMDVADSPTYPPFTTV